MKIYNHYADKILDRASHLRTDDAWFNAQLESDNTVVVPVWRSRNLIAKPEEPKGVFLSASRVRGLLNPQDTVVFLGLRNKIPHIALDFSRIGETAANNLHPGSEFVDLRAVGPVMDRAEASILAYAKGILYWHTRHKYCGNCGSPTESREAGHLRNCLNDTCKTPNFPRTDPAVIMLVSDGDRALLGRKAEWIEGI